MEKENRRANLLLGAITAAVLPAVIFTISTIFTDMFPGAGHSFIFGDNLLQFSIFSKEFMKRLFSGESLVYSFENGMGMPTVAINAFYSQSPFNILYLAIDNLEMASFCLVVCKLVFSSLCMYALLCRLFRIQNLASAFFSTAYSLCSFFSFFYVSFELLDMLYILPLIILGLVRFQKQGKWDFLCLVYSYSFIIHFYTAYITGIFSFIIFLVYSWYLYGRTAALWKKALVGYFKCVFIAILIASPLLIPAGYELFSMRTSDAEKLNSFVLYPWNFVAGLYPSQFYSIQNAIPYIYSGIPTVLLSIVFFFDPNVSRRMKVLAGVPMIYLILCSFIKPLYLFMHAFDAPNGYAFRFSWIICFCMILIAAKEYETSITKGIQTKSIYAIAIIWILVYILLYFIHTDSNPSAEIITPSRICLVLSITLLYVITMTRAGKGLLRSIILFILLTTELTANLIQGQKKHYETPPERYEYTIAGLHASNCLDELQKQESSDPWAFYRIHYLNSVTDNISMTYDFHGIGWFCSVENEKIRKVLSKLGYAASNLVAYDYGSTSLTQMLFAQKYSMECGYLYSAQAPYYTFNKNDYTLPLGYMVSSDMLNYQINDTNPFDAQNSLVSTMCGTPHFVYSEYNGVCYIEPTNIELIPYDSGTKVCLTDDFGQITYSIPSNPIGKTYAYMRRWGLAEIVPPLQSPLIRSNTDIGGMNRLSDVTLPHIFDLLPEDDGLCRLYVAMNSATATAFDYEAIYFAYENPNEIASVYSDLTPGAMTVTSFCDDDIEAIVTTTADKPLLFTTIPYDSSWHVYCDGKEIETYPVLDDAFLGVIIGKGDHNLQFVYKSKWVLVGRIVGVIGLLVFILSTNSIQILFTRFHKKTEHSLKD